jgi:hypothetical protein
MQRWQLAQWPSTTRRRSIGSEEVQGQIYLTKALDGGELTELVYLPILLSSGKINFVFIG